MILMRINEEAGIWRDVLAKSTAVEVIVEKPGYGHISHKWDEFYRTCHQTTRTIQPSTLSIPQLQNLAPLRHSGPTPRESRPYPIRQVLPPRRRATETQYRRDRAVFLQSLLPHKISLPSLTSSPSSVHFAVGASRFHGRWRLLIVRSWHWRQLCHR